MWISTCAAAPAVGAQLWAAVGGWVIPWMGSRGSCSPGFAGASYTMCVMEDLWGRRCSISVGGLFRQTSMWWCSGGALHDSPSAFYELIYAFGCYNILHQKVPWFNYRLCQMSFAFVCSKAAARTGTSGGSRCFRRCRNPPNALMIVLHLCWWWVLQSW